MAQSYGWWGYRFTGIEATRDAKIHVSEADVLSRSIIKTAGVAFSFVCGHKYLKKLK